MLKDRNKVLRVGIIFNIAIAIIAIVGIISVAYVYLKDTTDFEITFRSIQYTFTLSLIFIKYAFMILNGIISTVGFIRKNDDLLLISISMLAVIFVLCLIACLAFSITYGIFELILLFSTFILLLVGYILEKKEVKNDKNKK